MIINILIGVVTTICIWLTVIFLMSSKYQSVIEPLNDDEFVLKECYGVGFHLMKLFRVNMKGTIAWGKVCRILCERILCPAINIFVIFSGLIYVYVVHLFSGRSVNVDSVNACCTCCSELLFYCFVIRKDKEK